MSCTCPFVLGLFVNLHQIFQLTTWSMQRIADNIRFVGVEDDDLDLFEAQYPLPHGISYNSYVIEDGDIAIVDAVDIRRRDVWLERLSDALGDRRPRYLIVQHVEPDHSGSIGALLERYPDITVVATAKAIGMLGNYFEDVDFGSRSMAVRDGDTLCLGRVVLRFFTAPMVHWPEVMMSLDETDGVLFSADAFGSFAMPSTEGAWDAEARRYYCNIVGRYGSNVQSVMGKLKGRPFGVIAPLHGPVLSDNLAHYWSLYDKWSRYEPETDGVLVAYASIYGGTAEAARRLGALLEDKGAGEVVVMDLCRHDVSYAVAEAFRLSRMALCCSTYDSALFPAMYGFLHHLSMKNMRNRRVGLVENGSWAPAAARLMGDMLAHMRGMDVVGPAVTIHGRLHRDDLVLLDELATALS